MSKGRDAPVLAGVQPGAKRPRGLALLRTIIRNPIETWPPEIYEEPMVRTRFLGREIIFLADPDLVRQVLVEDADAFPKAAAVARTLRPALGNGLLTAEGASWRTQRRIVAPIFRHENLLRFVPTMIAEAERTRDRLLALASGAVADLSREMMHTTFGIIVETMLSGRAGIDVARVETGVTHYLETTGWRLALNLLCAPDWTPFPGRRRADRAQAYLRDEALRLIAERRAGTDGKSDLTALLLAARDPETGNSFSDQEIADNLLTFISAGHETTALALAWTFYLLALHPEIERRLVEDIRSAIGETGGLSPTTLSRLVYARQAIEEAMRLYPPAPIVARAARRDISLGGYQVKRGTPVYVPIYAMHRHRRLWSEPDRFDPERFRPEAAKARHRYSYLPFGAGPRICVGMGFAMLEAVVILAVLLPAFRFTLASDIPPPLTMRITLRPGGGMPMRVERR